MQILKKLLFLQKRTQMSELTRAVLVKYWGYPSFRPMQEDIVDSVIDGRDTLALLPTGGGTSICFQVRRLYCGHSAHLPDERSGVTP